MRKRLAVKAVWDSDLAALLESAGLASDLAAGSLCCSVCKKTVTLENLGTLTRRLKAATTVTCDTINCVREATAENAKG